MSPSEPETWWQVRGDDICEVQVVRVTNEYVYVQTDAEKPIRLPRNISYFAHFPDEQSAKMHLLGECQKTIALIDKRVGEMMERRATRSELWSSIMSDLDPETLGVEEESCQENA